MGWAKNLVEIDGLGPKDGQPMGPLFVPHHKDPSMFWCKAIHSTVNLINRLPTHVPYKISPFESLYQSPPSYTHLRTFGCTCFVHFYSLERKKLSHQAANCVLLGYSDEHKVVHVL